MSEGTVVVDRIRGVCPILAVPFQADGAVDLASFARLVSHVYQTGVSAAALFGFVSEFYKLDDDERSALTDVLLAETRDRAGVAAIVSVTDHAGEVAARRAAQLERRGADAINVLPPFLLAPGPDAVIAHFARVLEAVRIPVIAQYAPAQTGGQIDPQVWLKLAARYRHLRFVKVEAHPPGRYLSELNEGDAPIGGFVGYAGVQLPDALARGAAGVQPGCSFTEMYVELWHRWERGDAEGFETLHRAALPYLTYWMEHIELIVQAEKTILARRGIIANDYCRTPGYRLDAWERAMIDRFLAEFDGLLGSAK